MAGLGKLIQTVNKTTQKQIDELVKLRKQRKKDSTMSTVIEDVPSSKERALEDALRKKGVSIPGTSKRTTNKGG